jgi:hypothetical protein
MNTAFFYQFHDVWGNKWSFCSASMLSCLDPLVYLLLKSFKLFGFLMFWLWVYLIKGYSRNAKCAINLISMFLFGIHYFETNRKNQTYVFQQIFFNNFLYFSIITATWNSVFNSLHIEGTQVFKILLWLKCRTTIQHLFLCLISCNIG